MLGHDDPGVDFEIESFFATAKTFYEPLFNKVFTEERESIVA